MYQDLDMWLVVRSAADPTTLSAAIREGAQELRGDLPVADLASLIERNFNSSLASMHGGIWSVQAVF